MEYSKNFYQIKSNSEIFERLKTERKEIGYYDLPYQDTATIKDYAKSITNKHIVVLGIGGSSLGARAIYEFLLPSNNYTKDLLFLETIDPLKINSFVSSCPCRNVYCLRTSNGKNDKSYSQNSKCKKNWHDLTQKRVLLTKTRK